MMAKSDIYAACAVLIVMFSRYASWILEHIRSTNMEQLKPRVIDLHTNHDELEEILNIKISRTSDYPRFLDLHVVDARGEAISAVQSVNIDTGEVVIKLRSLSWHVMDLSETGEPESVSIRLGLRYLGIKINDRIEFSQVYDRPRTVKLEATW